MNRQLKFFLLPLAAVFALLPVVLQAQTMGTGTTPSVGFTPTPVNSQATTNGTVFATINFATGGVLGSWDFVIQGFATTEFTDYGNGTCAQMTTYSAGASCTVSVAFLPTLSGGKKGALRFKDQNGNVFGWVYVYGVGSAPVASVMYGGEKAFVELNGAGTTGQQVSNPTLGQGTSSSGIDVDYSGSVILPYGGGYELLYPTSPTQYQLHSGMASSNIQDPITSVARDGLGAVFAMNNTSLFRNAFLTALLPSNTYTTLTTSLLYTSSLDIDPQGNLWILCEDGTGVQKWTWTPGTTANGGYVISSPFPKTTSTILNIAIDPYGNIYEALATNYGLETTIMKGSYVNGTFTITTVLTVGRTQGAAALAVDLAGDIYYVLNPYSANSVPGPLYVARPTSSGYTVTQLGTIGNTFALAADRTGNVYTVDDNYFFRYSVTETPTAGSVTWTDTPYAGTTDTTAYTVPVANVGNLPLLFSSPTAGTNPSLPTGFQMASTSTCARQTPVSATQVLYPGQGCNLVLQFAPPGPTQYTGNVVFTDNSAGATQAVPVSGAAAGIGNGSTAQTITFLPPAAVNFSTTQAETMTASSTSQLPVFYTIVSGPATVAGSVVSFTGTGTVVVKAQQDGNATYAPAASVNASITVRASGTIWIVNSDSTRVRISDAGALVTAGFGKPTSFTNRGGLAFDSAGNAWSVTPTLKNTLSFDNSAGSLSQSFSGGGLLYSYSLAVDGAGTVWLTNYGNNTISEFTNAGVAISGASGFGTAAHLNVPDSLVIDSAGGIWIANRGSNSVTRLFGAATPVVTPLARGTANGTNVVEP